MAAAEKIPDKGPPRLRLGIGHPGTVMETAALSSMDLGHVYYRTDIPNDTIKSGQVSAVQLETIQCAAQTIDYLRPDGTGAGFLIGDGAGVGKGRTLAGIVYENYLKGRQKALWLSAYDDVKYEIMRELAAIGASRIYVRALNELEYGKISSQVFNSTGIILCSYSELISESKTNEKGKYRTRFRQLLQWCGQNFQGVIIFDECHKAKDLLGNNSKVLQTVLELQKKLPKARVVYASAQGASEPQNMAHMVRLGLWGHGTDFGCFNDFVTAVERRGVGAMEIVAMDMKLRGMYIARQLSFKGVSFRIEVVHLDRMFRKIYNLSVKLWLEAREKFSKAAKLIELDPSLQLVMWKQFWSSHQRFFKYLCIAAKVNRAILTAREAIKNGKCVVIGLQSTGEEESERDDDEELEDFMSNAKGVFQDLVERHFPAPSRQGLNRFRGLYEKESSQLEGSLAGEASQRKEEGSGGGKERKLKRRNGSGEVAETSRKRMRNTESEEVVNMNDKAGFIRDAKEKEEKAKVDKEKEEKEKEKVEMVNQNREREYVGTEDKENENKLNEDKKNEDKKNEDKKNGDTKNENKNKKNDDKENENKKNEIENKKNEIENKKNENENKKNEDKENENKKNEDKENENRKTENENTKNKNKENENENKKNEDKKNENKNNSDKKTDNKDTKDKKTKKHNAHQNTQDHKASSIQVARNATTDFYTFCTTTTSDVMNAALFDIELACSLKEELLRKIDYLGKRLPPNSLDHLIDELGGPENVAELTSRRGRIVQHKEGAIKYDWHVPLKTHNLDERRMFMNGLKNVAIISEPATSAWNLHSDRRERNKRRRVHITLELPWSTDMAIQQLGRTHRCNQVFTPEYIFLTTDLAGEQHFASALAKRLQTMGGHCVRRTKTTRDLSQFHIDNKYGLQALEKMMLTIMGYEMPLVPPPTDYSGEFFKDIAGALVGVGIIVNSESHPGVLSLDKDYNNISKFLNRILGCPVDLQNRLFKYFTDTITAIIQQAKRGGRFYLGIVDLGAPGRKVNRLRHLRFWRQHATGVAPTDLHTVRVEHGMKWRDAQAKYSDAEHDYEGFYLSHRSHNHKHTVIMALVLPSNGMISDSSSSDDSDSPKEKKRSTCNEKEIMCQVYRPNTGLQTRPQSLYELGRKYRKVRMLEAKPHWTEHYNNSMYACSHVFWNGNCGNVTQGNECEVGLRHRSYHILTGYVLCVWNRVEHLLNTVSNSKIQLVRVKTTDDMNIVGTLIPKDCYETLINDLRSDCEEQEEFNYCAGAANLKTDEEKLKYTRQKEEGKEVQEGST